MASQSQKQTCCDCARMARPWLMIWKARVPIIALPVLAGLRRLVGDSPAAATVPLVVPVLEATILFGISTGTGYFQLPFSVTWWLVLISAYMMETQLLLGVATVLSLSVLLGWYGSLLRYPQVICALWGGTTGPKKSVNGSAVPADIPLKLWRAWDLAVHALPAVLVLCWHGPAGTVSVTAAAIAFPLTLLWLWGVGLGLGKPLGFCRLSDAAAVYSVAPALPDNVWFWSHRSHWAVCTLWLVFLVLPTGYAWCVAGPLILKAWHSFAKSQLREDLLFGRTTFLLSAHVLAIVGAYKATVHPSSALLWFEVVVMWQVGAFGITCGAHRLWSHRAYVAKAPFRIVLMLLNSFSNQGTIYHWARDHRNHHKYTDTPADPHDATKGFFFAHVGWLLIPKHPEVKAKGESIPCNDLLNDPVVAFQKWAEEAFMFNELVSFLLPAVYSKLVHNDAWLGFLVHGMLRWVISLHATWCVNSVAHFFGDNKYDHSASPRESPFVAIVAAGEGWHSYHHKYPWDYATAELGADRRWNPSKLFIDLAAALGQAENLKRADHIARRAQGVKLLAEAEGGQ